MTLKTRLTLGFAAIAVLVLALGAVSLYLLAAVQPAGGRLAVASLCGATCAGLALLAVASVRAAAASVVRAEEQTDTGSPAPTSLAPAEPEPRLHRNPYADRRGPNRAVNVVRPAFGQPEPSQLTGASRAPDLADDWEPFDRR